MLDLTLTTADPLNHVSQILRRLRILPVSIDENRLLIDSLGQPHQIIPILRQVLNNNSLLTEVAGRSYRHINLFDKIVLVGNDDPHGYRLTLHFWRPPYSEEQRNQELIHEHRFNFWSTILTGTLASEVFEKGEAGGTFRQYRYVPETNRTHNFHDFYEFQGEVNLRSSLDKRKQSGESYYLAAPIIHRIVLPRTRITCSLVLRGPRLRSYSYIYNSRYPSENTKFQNTMFTEGELATRLKLLLQVLKQESLHSEDN